MAERSRFVVDQTGARCRDRSTGQYADCNLCKKCPITKRRKQ